MRNWILLLAGACGVVSLYAQETPQSPAPVKRMAERAIGGGTTLTLKDVLDSVERNYPPLLAVLQDRVVADADVLVAEGQFDTRLRSGFTSENLGFYENRRLTFGLEQPLQWQGMSFASGYRLGSGDFASYEGKSLTRDLGEGFTSVRFPLFRDREIDGRRATLRKAVIGRKIADLGIDQQKLVITQSATRVYWDWVFAGQRYEIAYQLLRIAEDRDRILREAVRIGQLPQVDVVDNERVIAQRRGALVDARRALQAAGISLSLFYRDDTGRPVIAANTQLPGGFPEPEDIKQDRATQDIQAALQYRPEVERLNSQLGQVAIDRQLAKNQLLPNVDLVSGFTTQIGAIGRVVRGPQELTSGIEFVLPFQRRQAKGADAAARARETALQQRLRFQRDQIEAEVRDALSAVENARDRVLVTRQELEQTRRVEEAEALKYRLGDTTLFVLNLRERDTADAALRVAASEADYHRAMALYQFAVAEALR